MNIIDITPEEIQNMDPEELTKALMTHLETVIDPEIGIDLVNLGLVYDVEITPEGFAKVTITLTSMGCPMADQIVQDLELTMKEIKMVKEVEVEIVWYPSWSPERMSRYARIALGMKFQ